MESYLHESIESVLNQSYNNCEIIVVNDGSTDNTSDIARSFSDLRIKYFAQNKKGVSAARNLGLEKMTGKFFCFLDADDVMPTNGLRERLEIFHKQPDLSFVDGKVVYCDENMKWTGRQYVPSFEGYPYNELLRLNRECYFGNTWMIKREAGVHYQFDEEMTHAEDLYFYLTIAKDRKYAYTKDPVLYYRERKDSAMKDLTGLEQGYVDLLIKIKEELHPDPATFKALKKRIMRIMFLSHLFDGRDPYSAAKSLFRYLTKA